MAVRFSLGFVVIGASLLATGRPVIAQACAVGGLSVTVSHPNQASCSVTRHADGSYRVRLERTNDPFFGAPVYFEIVGATGAEVIEEIEAVAPTTYWTTSHVSIHGPGGFSPVASLGRMVRTGGWWSVDLLLLDGDLGATRAADEPTETLVVDALVSANVRRDVIGDLVIGRPDGPGDLSTLLVGRHFRGNLSVPAGQAQTLSVSGELTGRTATEHAIIHAHSRIGRVEARSMLADVSTDAGSRPDQINLVRTAVGGFTGSITTGELLSFDAPEVVNIAGDFSGVLNGVQSDGVVRIGGSLSPESRLRLGGALHVPADGGPSIRIDAPAGLHGQVILGGDQRAAPAPHWDEGATVIAGAGVVIGEPHYGDGSESLGGGAIGDVPYALHDQDCRPPNAISATTAVGLVLVPPSLFVPPVLLRHYGPIRQVPGSGPPLLIEIQVASGAWVDITPMFKVTVRPEGVFASERTVSIATYPGAGPPAMGIYRASPVPGRLVCDDEGGLINSPSVDVQPYTYHFQVVPDCNGNGVADPAEIAAAGMEGLTIDCNNNGFLDFCDIQVFHTSGDANGDGVPDECTQPTCRADWNHNGQIEPADIASFIAQWHSDLQHGTHATDFNLNFVVEPADVALFSAVWFANLAQGC